MTIVVVVVGEREMIVKTPLTCVEELPSPLLPPSPKYIPPQDTGSGGAACPNPPSPRPAKDSSTTTG